MSNVPELFKMVHKTIDPIPVDGAAVTLAAWFLTPGSTKDKLKVAGSIAVLHGLLHHWECAADHESIETNQHFANIKYKRN